MSKRGPVCFLIALAVYFIAVLIGPRDYWRVTVLKVLEPAGMILFIFGTYYSGEAIIKEFQKGHAYFGGKGRNTRIALLAVFLMSLTATILLLALTRFPVSGR